MIIDVIASRGGDEWPKPDRRVFSSLDDTEAQEVVSRDPGVNWDYTPATGDCHFACTAHTHWLTCAPRHGKSPGSPSGVRLLQDTRVPQGAIKQLLVFGK